MRSSHMLRVLLLAVSAVVGVHAQLQQTLATTAAASSNSTSTTTTQPTSSTTSNSSTTSPAIQGQVSSAQFNNASNTTATPVQLGFTTLRPTNNTRLFYTDNFYSGVVVPPLSGVVQFNYSLSQQNTSITLIITNVPNGTYSLQLREYGNLYDQTYGPIFNDGQSSNAAPGCAFYLGQFQVSQEYMNASSIYTFYNGHIGMNGTSSIIGRSVLIINETLATQLSGIAPSCSVINTQVDVQAVVADGVVGLANPDAPHLVNTAIQPNVDSNTSTIADLVPSSLYYFAGYLTNECLMYNTTTKQLGQVLCNTSIPQQYFSLQPTTYNSSTFQLVSYITGECWAANSNNLPSESAAQPNSTVDQLTAAQTFNAFPGSNVATAPCNITDPSQYWSIDLTNPFTLIQNPQSNLCFYSFSSVSGGVAQCDVNDAAQAWSTHLLPQVESFVGSVQYYTNLSNIYQLVNITGLIPYSTVGLFITTFGVDPDASNALAALVSQSNITGPAPSSNATSNTTIANSTSPTAVPTAVVTITRGTQAGANSSTTSTTTTTSSSSNTVITTQIGSFTVPARRLQQMTSSPQSSTTASTSAPAVNSAATPAASPASGAEATKSPQLSNTSAIVGSSETLTSSSNLIFTADRTGTIYSELPVGNIVLNNKTYNVIGRGVLLQYLSAPSVPAANSSLLYSGSSYLAFGVIGINDRGDS